MMILARSLHGKRWPVVTASHASVILLTAGVIVLIAGRVASPPATNATSVRAIEPRLSGIRTWAPFRAGAPREPIMHASLRGPALDRVRYATGVQQLLAGDTRQALASLRTAAEKLNEATAWSDLSAAYHEAAIRYDAPQLFADAVTAADRALTLDPALPEALFNRALMIERLGLHTDARKAWQRYLQIDPDSAWAAEAQAHLGALPLSTSFRTLLSLEYGRIASDPSVAASVVARDPFGARGTGLVVVLGRWGAATLRGDAADAQHHLAVARALGGEVARRGDHTLQHAVATIEAATGKARAALAAAHADYQEGILAFIDKRPADAEPLLRGAASVFEERGSAMIIPARYFTANAVYEQGHHDEAERLLERLLATTSDDYPAYHAFIHWQLGICRRSYADWGQAIAHFEQSAALFARVGETQNLKTIHCQVAFVYDRIGDRESAWQHRTAALRHTPGPSFATVDEKLTSAIAEAAVNEGEWHKAASFLELHAEYARRQDDQRLLAETMYLRAVVHDRLRNSDGVRADLAAARAARSLTKDRGYIASLRITELRTLAMLRDTSPARAEALLTEALHFRTTESDPPSLPDLLLQRARARRKTGNAAGALDDIEQGIAELEAKRETLPEGELRWGAFHGAEDLFHEGVDVAMELGDVERAFRFAERARARSLLDSYGRSPLLDHRQLPADTIVVAYAALASKLVIFTADASGIRAKTIDVAKDVLAQEVAALGRALRADVLNARAVTQRLIVPVRAELVRARTIVFVPDATTATVAFSALNDANGRLLLRDHVVVVAASAAAYVAAYERRQGAPAHPVDALLVSASGATEDLAALEAADREAEQIGSIYPRPTRIDDGEQFRELARRAPFTEVLHFGGHAIGDESGLQPASIVLERNGREHRVSASEISRLRLRPSAVVVLAGCNTARGERRAAEGVSSVAHGFLSAGAASVIATLWPIDDRDAARFFPRVHRRLAAGMSAAEALRGAQLESIQRGDVPTSLWAAVQNMGS